MTIRFERTWDWNLVRSILGRREIFAAASDDGTPDISQWNFNGHEDVWFVTARDSGELMGLWVFIPVEHYIWTVHIYLLPNAYGERGREASKELALWIWGNTPCLQLIGEIPEYNRLSLSFAKSIGMQEIGEKPNSIMKYGRLWAKVLVSLERPGTN